MPLVVALDEPQKSCEPRDALRSAEAGTTIEILPGDYLRAEAAQGRRKDFQAVLDRATDVPPLPGDERP